MQVVVRGFLRGPSKVFFSCISLIGVWVCLLGWWEVESCFVVVLRCLCVYVYACVGVCWMHYGRSLQSLVSLSGCLGVAD